MELSERKQAVLKAIIKAYIETGEPIGSKILTTLLKNSPSPATLRNEMNELCSLGFLTQPHTSAGRVPTNAGFRIYVNSLMNKGEINQSAKELLENRLGTRLTEPEKIPKDAAELLTELTGLPAISCLLTERSPRIKRIELLAVGKSAVMLLIITDDGRSRSRIFRKAGGFSCEEQQVFLNLCEKKLKGKPLNEINKAYIQGTVATLGIYSLELLPLFSAILEACEDIEQASVILNGENALYNICGDEVEARQILSLIKSKDPMLSVLEGTKESATAVFGCDTHYRELNNRTLIAARYNGGEKYKGYIGVIGPNRMSYEQIMPVIEYTASVLTKKLTEAQKDMED